MPPLGEAWIAFSVTDLPELFGNRYEGALSSLVRLDHSPSQLEGMYLCHGALQNKD